MTITEQLQFSVLTAPVASLDRRALSQAWYSALYGHVGGTAKEVYPQAPAAPGGADAGPRCARAARTSSRPALDSRRPATGQPSGRPCEVPLERRAPRSELARNIERALLRSRTTAHRSSFTIDAGGARVHVILHARGARLKIVAVCPPKARTQVAAALAQARYALAMRGIDLEPEMRGGLTCE